MPHVCWRKRYNLHFNRYQWRMHDVYKMDVNSYIIILSLFTVFAFCYDTSFIQISCDDPGNETIEVSLGDDVNLQFLICLPRNLKTWGLAWEKDGKKTFNARNTTTYTAARAKLRQSMQWN